MKRTRSTLVGLLLAGLFLIAAEPVAAQSSINDQLIGDLNNVLLYAAIPITLLVQVILLYAVIKFRNNDEPRPTQENRRLEITWTVATAIVLLFVGLASYQVMADPFITHQHDDVPGEDDVEIDVVAYNYGWDFIYEDEGIESTGEAVIPTDTEVYFNVTADAEQNSYIHGFHVPDLGLKQDANPGETNTVKTEVYDEGEYQGYCSKYCGVGHSNMYFTLDAVGEDEYEDWVTEQQANGDDEEAEEEEMDEEAEEEEAAEDAEDAEEEEMTDDEAEEEEEEAEDTEDADDAEDDAGEDGE
ncbi:cytochrome c oxidase subunit II [Halalkalicoccus tibetensis]|uniref:cytochrome-c oxidase n=1 Tax=Halalkalicoccus tibetensis TaxID=175632 RepID=A0ABD5V7Q5_9EURY